MRNEFDDELDRDNSKGRRGSYSKPDPSDKDYYLDDDYVDQQNQGHGGANQTRKSGGVSRGQSPSGTGTGKPQGTPRYQQMSGRSQGESRSQVPSGTRTPSPSGQGTSKNQIVIGDGGTRQSSRTQAGDGGTRQGSRTQTGNPATRQSSRTQTGNGGTRQGGRAPIQEKNGASGRSSAQTGKKKKIRRIIIMAVAEIFALALIFSYAYVTRIMSAIQRPDNFDEKQVRNEIMSPEQKKHMTGYRNIAIFGVDSRDGNVNKGANADVIMICNINRDTGEIRLVSVFRDTYLNTNDGNTYNKINSAYANGGAAQALAALNKNLDMDISEYVTFNWKSVADGINMLGGVDIDISKAEFRYINSFITETVKKTGVGSVHLKSAGMNHLDGVQAVAYARLRKMDTDYARTERQRLVIQKSFDKAKKADLGLLNRILLMEVEQIGTNLTFSDFTDLLLDINKFHIGETGGFPFARGDMKMGKKGDCVIPQTLETNVVELHKFLFGKEDYTASEMVKKISAKIAADSGMYKQGKSVDHVPTDKGVVSKKDEEEKKKTTEAETSAHASTAEETDADGKPVKKPETSESSTGETKETKPGETKPSATKGSEAVTGSTRPGETKPASTTGAAETTKADHGPGSNQTPETESETVGSAGPAGPGQTAGSHTPGGDTSATEVQTVDAPPVNQ